MYASRFPSDLPSRFLPQRVDILIRHADDRVAFSHEYPLSGILVSDLDVPIASPQKPAAEGQRLMFISLPHSRTYRYFLPAAATRPLKTGLLTSMLT